MYLFAGIEIDREDKYHYILLYLVFGKQITQRIPALKIKTLHEWPGNARDAKRIQRKISPKVIIESVTEIPQTVAAVDTAIDSINDHIFASAVIFSFPELIELEHTMAKKKANFPYISGLMTFREGPAILKALLKFKETPDLVIYHGHGIAHPRFFGLASHLGVLTGIPSVGCAMKNLTGDYDMPLTEKGGKKPLFVDGYEVGCVYRSRTNVKPIFISPGHLCDMHDAVNIVTNCLKAYRMPEPLRKAHLYANNYKRLFLEKSKIHKDK